MQICSQLGYWYRYPCRSQVLRMDLCLLHKGAEALLSAPPSQSFDPRGLSLRMFIYHSDQDQGLQVRRGTSILPVIAGIIYVRTVHLLVCPEDQVHLLPVGRWAGFLPTIMFYRKASYQELYRNRLPVLHRYPGSSIDHGAPKSARAVGYWLDAIDVKSQSFHIRFTKFSHVLKTRVVSNLQ